MEIEKNKRLFEIWVFAICALIISFFINWLQQAMHLSLWVFLAPVAVGILAFLFQIFVNQKPLIELYSKGYPYRKLKPYGVLSAFLLFEFVLVWGLHTKQILTLGEDLFLITVIFVGVIVYYHAFVRMKISLRFLFLAVFIPSIAVGAALGLASYFKILKFVVPTAPIGNTVFFNTIYWILSCIFLQMVCEEVAFRGYLMQRLLNRGELFAILLSSLIFAIWRIPFDFFAEVNCNEALLSFCGNLITGGILALLFIKGRNLLVAILCRGIIDGLRSSLFASSANPGISQYVEFLFPQAKVQLLGLWLACLFVGLILLTVIPRKKLDVH